MCAELVEAPFDRRRPELVEGLRAQGGERPPGCSADSNIGIRLKTYDGVTARCLGLPVSCPRLDIEGSHQLDLALGPAGHGIRRLPGCLPGGFKIGRKPSY